MRETFGNLWKVYTDDQSCVVCVTTNGFVKKSGECVMGRGCAREASARWPWLPKCLGTSIKEHGNNLLYLPHIRLVLFPTKIVWWDPSDVDLIKRSAEQLRDLAVKNRLTLFYLPRPGCSNGRLDWRTVRPAIEKILPDNVIAITNER